MLKKISSEKINVTKNDPFFFREIQLIIVLLLIRNSMRAEAQGSSLKNYMWDFPYLIPSRGCSLMGVAKKPPSLNSVTHIRQ